MNDEELSAWFAANKTILETAYIAGTNPWQQSGVGLALIADIHGDLFTLDAVLADIRHHDIEQILCLGYT